MEKIVKFKVKTVRTMPSPYQKAGKSNSKLENIYYLLVNMKDLPSDIPLDVNPRVPKMTTNVAKRLVNAVVEPETDFYINNRGIVISAKSLSYNSLQSEVTIDLGDQDDEEDKYDYGILDGGHTYTAIMQHRDEIPCDFEKYVRIEVVTNVVNITRLSDARNTSVQVSDEALFNLEDNFEYIRKAIECEPYADRVAFKDNEDKELSVSDFLRLMFAFDVEKYPDDTMPPIQSYSGKAQVFKRYKNAYNTPFYIALTKELPKLVELYDLVEKDLPEKYIEYKKKQGVSNPRFGNVKGVEKSEKGLMSNFLQNKIDYAISSGYIYPIFGAFRALLKYDKANEEVNWVFDPVDIWQEVGTSLAQNTFEMSTMPQLCGKDKQLWLANYRIVETQMLRDLLSAR